MASPGLAMVISAHLCKKSFATPEQLLVLIISDLATEPAITHKLSRLRQVLAAPD